MKEHIELQEQKLKGKPLEVVGTHDKKYGLMKK
jgi:hypothetical protein